ncbi:HEAT repeat domain-containing protein [Flagellimonas flava]|uniref:HEAT repeat-containing protein n=1 Tax=Flagellimonas flava TaxID=570519 RepID=A0A1M5LQC9_9FLAO|nr:HEAT repeat domain-containing protein [Allomuricauda flava]SHG67261.1 HEAT repeat-containing protein [Allomuricauda flava]
MDKEQFEIQAMEYLSGAMTDERKLDFEKFIGEHPNFKIELQELQDTLEMVKTMDAPEPSAKMDTVFFSSLSEEIGRQKAKQIDIGFLRYLWPVQKSQWILGLVVLCLGLAIGYLLNDQKGPEPIEVVTQDDETESMRQKLVLTLLEQPSANQRLQGVSEANKFEEADEIVIRALLQTLNNDSNVNVRLAAIESLTNYVDRPEVRQGLVQSIPNQESPILQITLANLMVALQEKASVEPFKELLKEKKLDTTVKKKLQNSIESII